MGETVFIEKDGDNRLKPRDATSFFSKNPELWEKLKHGEVIEVPIDVKNDLIAIRVIEKKGVKSLSKKEIDTAVIDKKESDTAIFDKKDSVISNNSVL